MKFIVAVELKFMQFSVKTRPLYHVTHSAHFNMHLVYIEHFHEQKAWFLWLFQLSYSLSVEYTVSCWNDINHSPYTVIPVFFTKCTSNLTISLCTAMGYKYFIFISWLCRYRCWHHRCILDVEKHQQYLLTPPWSLRTGSVLMFPSASMILPYVMEFWQDPESELWA